MPIKPAPAVLRAMDVLQLLMERAPEALSMSEIARGTELSKATCHSVLLALLEGGYVRRDPSSLGYSLGAGLIPLGTVASSSIQLPELARPELEALADELGVTTVASVAVGQHMVVVSAMGPPRPFQLSLPVGQLVPFMPPLGAAFVAWAGPDEIDAWLDRSPTPLPADDRVRLVTALEHVRQVGYSVTLDVPVAPELRRTIQQLGRAPDAAEVRSRRDELFGQLGSTYLPTAIEEGRTHRLSQVSSPVFDPAGTVVMVVVVVAVGLELATDEIAAVGERVRSAAARLTALVGGRSPGGFPGTIG